MPLDKSGSKASVSRNIRAELDAGKPRRQAIAIALDVKRRAVATIRAKLRSMRRKGGCGCPDC